MTDPALTSISTNINVTKPDLTAAVAELRASLIKWLAILLIVNAYTLAGMVLALVALLKLLGVKS